MNNLFKETRILVVGDVILDKYLFGEIDRISPEAPVPVVNVKEEVEKLGGAGNVARNAVHLGSKITLLGLIGNDKESEVIYDLTQREGIDAVFLESQNPTIVKSRVLSRGQQLLRFDLERPAVKQAGISIVSKFKEIAKSHDLVIASDYGKGALSSVPELIKICKDFNIPILVDPKGNDFEKYTGSTLITPNKKEFETIVGQCSTLEELEIRACELVKNLKIQYLLVTKGPEGMSLFDSEGACHHFKTQAEDVFDVTGAGDTVCAVMGVALSSSNYSFEEAAALANTAAGIVVKKMGAAAVEPFELEWALGKHSSKIFRNAVCPGKFCRVLKTQNKKIVFTNGCFDLIHAGHIKYLKEASELGDVLIVGLNSDSSVNRQKGPGRPVNTFIDRAEVLCGLSVVDFIIEFEEDDPLELIKAIEPDVLVKGGDYVESEIVGYNEVKRTGGQVKSLNYYDNNSSSKIINKIKNHSE
ncbi:MAG: hypothetical protein CBC29_07900 [Methylococcaceae bacterium TMED69]|nr:MAG: hypothetical protein CBC29_07900 [Methylococcaceae bacterium TMED69]